jgi:hypothetical protein
MTVHLHRYIFYKPDNGNKDQRKRKWDKDERQTPNRFHSTWKTYDFHPALAHTMYICMYLFTYVCTYIHHKFITYFAKCALHTTCQAQAGSSLLFIVKHQLFKLRVPAFSNRTVYLIMQQTYSFKFTTVQSVFCFEFRKNFE